MLVTVPELPRAPDHMQMVGQICGHWQHLEFSIDATIWRWAGLSRKRGICFTATMQHTMRIHVLKSIARVRFGSQDLDKALLHFAEGPLRHAKGVRDKFAHALWAKAPNGEPVIIEKYDRLAPEVDVIRPSIREMTSGAIKIVAARVAFEDLVQHAERGTKGPLPKTPRIQDALYDQIVAARANQRAKRARRRRPSRPSRG